MLLYLSKTVNDDQLLFSTWMSCRSSSEKSLNWLVCGGGLVCICVGFVLFCIYQSVSDRAKNDDLLLLSTRTSCRGSS